MQDFRTMGRDYNNEKFLEKWDVTTIMHVFRIMGRGYNNARF